MGSRAFTDSAGQQWTVWDVRPEYGERRSGGDRRSGRDRRVDPTRHRPGARPDRRSGLDRRVALRSRGIVQPGYEHGWLCFAAGGQRRRLAPIPGNWEECSDRALEAYCARAAVVTPSTRSA